jgi:fido (protein-threonine AMPylation protein)
MYEAKDSIYCYDGTDVLVNKEDIRDSKKLELYEKNIVSLNLAELEAIRNYWRL